MATAEQQVSSPNRTQDRDAQRIEIVLLMLILLVAGLLRMAYPGLTEFKADEARLLALALDMAEGDFALRGISSSVGFPNFPASVWLYSIPLLLWPHPYSATLFTGLLNTLAVAGSYWLVRRYWGVSAALAAAFMLAVSPWAVIFSRKIWAQNLLPLFVLGWAIGGLLALVEERPKFIWLHLVCLALAVQIHLAAIALIPATAILLLVFWRRIHWRTLVLGLFLAAVTIVPFTTFLIQSGQEIGLPAAITSAASPGITADSLRFTTMLSLGTNIHSLAGPEAFRQYLAKLPPMTAVYWLWGLLILSGVLVLAWQAAKNWEQQASQAGLVILVWLFMPALFFLWHGTPLFLHYFIATLPAQYIAAGVAINRIPNLASRWSEAGQMSGSLLYKITWGVLIMTAVAQVWALVTLFNFLGSTATPGAFGVPLAMKLEAADLARSLFSSSEAAEIIIAGPGESVRLDAFPAEWDVLLRDTPHRFVDVDRSALFPAHAAVVLLDQRQISPTWTGDLYLQAAASSTEILLRPGEGAYTILELPAQAKPQPDYPREPPDLFANWVNLLGHDELQRLDPETGLWQIHWRTGDNPDPSSYQFFNHLLDQNGQRIGQADAAAFAPWQWQAGDTLVSRFLIPWSAAQNTPASMRVGMYRFPSLENVPLLDIAGNPFVDAATLLLDN